VNKSLRRLVFFTCSEKIEDSSTTNEEQEMIVMMPSEVRTDTEADLSDNDEGDVLAGGGMSVPISSVH
jgi:hypothetical protein